MKITMRFVDGNNCEIFDGERYLLLLSYDKPNNQCLLEEIGPSLDYNDLVTIGGIMNGVNLKLKEYGSVLFTEQNLTIQ